MVRLHLANQHYRAGAYRDAVTEYAAVVKADPQHAFALNNLASAYLKLDDKRALSVAEAAHRLKPDQPNILDTLGVAQMRYGDAKLAAETLKKAIGRQPQVAEFRVNYALALAKSGEKAAARAELQNVVAGNKGLALEPEAKALLEAR
jgi:Flp pilus assembly protein TadD